MKPQHLLCCATVAFVNQRIQTISGSNRDQSRLRIEQKLQLHLDVDVDEDGNDGNGDVDFRQHPSANNNNINSRRRFLFRAISKSVLPSALLLTTTGTASPARAACLSGDVRSECIGVYKLPIDAPESSFFESPEMLKINAPDLRWVPPAEYPRREDAVRQLREQRARLDDARDLVAKGDIEGSGLVLLDVIPKVTASGIVITRAFGDASNAERNAAMKNAAKYVGCEGDECEVEGINRENPSSTPRATAIEMKAYRIDVALTELLGTLGEADILIGQGLRGELGVSAPAQIEILGQLADCRREFDELLGTVPEDLAKDIASL